MPAGTGILVLIYHGVMEDPSKDFDLDVGFPIEEKVTPAGDYKVRDVAEYPCVSVLFNGSLAHLGSAFEKLVPAAMGGAANPPANRARCICIGRGWNRRTMWFTFRVGVK